MARRAISVTLEMDNVAWLKGRAGAAGESVSEMIDQLVTAARRGSDVGQARSVAGTIQIDSADPLLERADAAVRAAFETSLQRPGAVRERKVTYTARSRKSKNPRG
jgi:hypothetical protein